MKTVLPVPGHKKDWFQNAMSSNADIVMFDVEDSVPQDKKQEAIKNILNIDYKMVRINFGSEEHKIFDKIDSTIVIPKINTWYDLNFISDIKQSTIGVIIETPKAVINLEDILICYHDKISVLFFGYMDFINLTPNGRAELLSDHARLKISMYANAYGIPFIDSPCLSKNINDLRMETERAILSGCTGKGVMMPSQIDVVNEMFKTINDKDLLEISKNTDPIFVRDNKIIGPAVINRLRNEN